MTVRSSLSYQILIQCNKPYSIFLFLALLALNIYKGNVLPYQTHVRVMELLILLSFAPIEAVRLAWASRGNLTETPAFIGFSLFLSAASGAICCYLAVFQNYGVGEFQLGTALRVSRSQCAMEQPHHTLPVFLITGRRHPVLLVEAIIVYMEAAFLILETVIGLTLVATLKGSD